MLTMTSTGCLRARWPWMSGKRGRQIRDGQSWQQASGRIPCHFMSQKEGQTMKFESLGSSVGSKLIPRRHGAMPAIERTEGEKIKLARLFLEKRGFVILCDLMTASTVCAYLGCSRSHLDNLIDGSDFPKPFNLSAAKTNIDSSRAYPRWKSRDVMDWIESRKTEPKQPAALDTRA